MAHHHIVMRHFNPHSTDAEDIYFLESHCLGEEWAMDRQAFNALLQHEPKFVHVLELNGSLLGYALFSRGRRELNMLRLVIHPGWRRLSLATMIVRKAADITKAIGFKEIFCAVPETRLDAHLFLSETGFKATAVRKHLYFGKDTDAYLFKASPADILAKPLRTPFSNVPKGQEDPSLGQSITATTA